MIVKEPENLVNDEFWIVVRKKAINRENRRFFFQINFFGNQEIYVLNNLYIK